ncbi:MAG: VOC family protein [Pseudolabrys sp.]|nr:VOC family protein [Pseudolabrys sp.]
MPANNITTYLNFNGRCEEALEFYKKTLGARIEGLMRFKEAPQQGQECKPENQNKVMHSAFWIGDTMLMATDGMLNGEAVKFDGFTLTISAKDKAEVDRHLSALSEGGAITMPASETFFAERFGMAKDKFGVHWIALKQKPM